MRTVKNLHKAQRCDPRLMQKVTSTWAKAGLSYERNVVKALTATFGPDRVIHNPWYYFEDDNGPGYAVPDILVDHSGVLAVIECKLKYKGEAIEKLERLYRPIVTLAEGVYTVPLVVTKHLVTDAPEAALNYSAAIMQQYTLLHWIGKGAIA